jgi:cysteine desulfuration protein SufE
MDQKIEKIIKEFADFDDWEGRYKHLIGLGKGLEGFPEEHRLEQNKVKGCQSQVWLHADLGEAHNIHFFGDSDASIVKGIVALLLRIYSDRTPDEIMNLDQSFVEELGLKQHLSMSRANGLSAMMKQIQFFAMAYKAKIDMGIIVENHKKS